MGECINKEMYKRWKISKEEEYKKITRKWFKNNPLLKIENKTFILCTPSSRTLALDDEVITLMFFLIYDEKKNFYWGSTFIEYIGEMIYKGKITRTIKKRKDFIPISKEKFIKKLIDHDLNLGSDIFTHLNLSQLPEWLVPELVAEKLIQT